MSLISRDPSPARHFIVTAPAGQSRETLARTFLEDDPQARITVDLPLINGFAVETGHDLVTSQQHLRAVAPRARVTEDRVLSLLPEPPHEPRVLMNVAAGSLGLRDLWDRGVEGKGVGIAVIDTGVAPHPDLRDRIVAFKDLVAGKEQAYDDAGHGTHVAGIAAGSGEKSGGKYTGCAPGAEIIGIKVIDGRGQGRESTVLAGIQWAVENREKYHIRVINLSIGEPATQSYRDDPVAMAVEAAAAAGIVPCVAAGNAGPSTYTIATPGNAPSAITVGALDDRGTYDHSDDRPARFSSRGPTAIDGLEKPDVLAPGVDITATSRKGRYEEHSGTSMASPIVAGVAALLLQGHPETTPAEVKAALMGTAYPLAGVDGVTQGRGGIDPVAAWKALNPQPSS